jgi:long-chain fatty acid transport protein
MRTAMHIRLVAALLLCCGAAWAGGYAVPNVNARDLSMAGSVVAGQKDATATYVNPAALAGLEGFSVVANATAIDFRSKWTNPDPTANQSTSSLMKGAFPPSLFASYGANSDGIGWGVGAGFNVPFGGNVYWPNGWPGQFDILTVNRRTYAFYLTGGVQPLPQIKFGGGLIYYRTTEDLSQGFNFLSQIGSAELGTAGGKLSYDVSAEITPITGFPLTIGIDYKHKADQTLTGTAHFTNAPSALGPQTLDQTLSHALSVPNLLNVGVAVRLIPNLLLTGAYTFDRFIVYKSDVFAGDAGTTVTVIRDYKNGYTFRFGGEVEDLVPRFTFRAGVLRDISPTRPRALNASIPDANTTAVGLGVGYEIAPRIKLNASYFHAFFDQITTTGIEVLPGTYDTRANIYTIGVAWEPGAQPASASAGPFRRPQ